VKKRFPPSVLMDGRELAPEDGIGDNAVVEVTAGVRVSAIVAGNRADAVDVVVNGVVIEVAPREYAVSRDCTVSRESAKSRENAGRRRRRPTVRTSMWRRARA